jgi:hypothetical protein
VAAGAYTLRAYRSGGGEAIAIHVRTGTSTRLQIRLTASLEGTVTLRSGGAPDELTMIIRAMPGGLYRRERLFRTAGHYALRDLPAGSFELAIDSPSGAGKASVTLAQGEHATLDLTLEPVVTLAGTLVDHATRAPLAGYELFAQRRGATTEVLVMWSEVTPNVSDARGRFTIDRAPAGDVVIVAISRQADRSRFELPRTIPVSSGVIELGEVAVVRPRLRAGERAGKLGVRFTQREVAWIDPRGPAAKTELAVGDVVTSIDDTDVTGEHESFFAPMLQAPPGTALRLGLARGTSVSVVLGP